MEALVVASVGRGLAEREGWDGSSIDVATLTLLYSTLNTAVKMRLFHNLQCIYLLHVDQTVALCLVRQGRDGTGAGGGGVCLLL